MVELRNLSYRVGDARILEDVTATFQRGRFNVVLGPNGAGKSTLLRLATGLAHASSGSVRYDDRPVESMSAVERARMRAVLSQHVELAFPLPARDVVMMGRYPHYDRVPTARDRDIVRQALDLVGMSDRSEQPYSTLSGGEQQKIQLARVVSQIWPYDDRGPGEHRYLFLDEPTSSLDVHYQLHLLDAAVDLLAHDCTVVAILHDLNMAFTYGDRFLVLEQGRVALEAERAEDVTPALVERVFRVRARTVAEPGESRAMWRFTL